MSITELSFDEIKKEILKFKNDVNVNELEKYYYTKSFPEILGISRKELIHSNFIAWLLNKHESHSLGDFSILKLLEILVFRSNDKIKNLYEDFFDSILTDDLYIVDCKIETEKVLKDVGRLDIYFEGVVRFNNTEKKLRIIIENKVQSAENNSQTLAYFKHFESLKNADDINLYIYLTPIPTLELNQLTEPECDCKDFIQINYQSLVDHLIEPALNLELTESTKHIIEEYLMSLSQPTLNQGESEGSKTKLIMALGKKERQLLTKFWDRHQKLIMSALFAISSDPEQDEETRNNINDTLDSLSESSRNTSTFSLFYNGDLFNGEFKKADIGYQTVKLLEEKGLLSDDNFSFLRDDTTGGFNLIKSKQEIVDGTPSELRKFRINKPAEIIYNGCEYYIIRNWSQESAERFLNKIKSRFPEVTYLC